jgi:hypothetical protein
VDGVHWELKTQGKDLAMDGVRIAKLEANAFRRTLGITQERHAAFD